jgi:6-phosphogluconolactonase (cycloisomerase 2 family)
MSQILRYGSRITALVVCLFVMSGLAAAATQYVITNDDPDVTFYSVAPDGTLILQQRLQTGGFGIVAGFFGANRIALLNGGDQQCAFVSIASTNEIAEVAVPTLTVVGSVSGSPTDDGSANGIGLAVNSQYLYASFTASNTIGTFQIEPGCTLAFVDDVSVGGLAGGMINGMAIHGNLLIASFTDGSIQSFNISGGTPLPNTDEQYSSATITSRDATYPNSIDITKDGHYAIFGDTSTSMVVEVSDISSGKLAPTIVYSSKASISSSNIMLSPDESMLYVVNTQGDTVSAVFFDPASGTLSKGCTSNRIKGQSANWSYLGGLALINETGNGGGIYVAEFGNPAGIAMVTLNASPGKCSLQEIRKSPFADPNSQGLLSIGAFPPRDF